VVAEYEVAPQVKRRSLPVAMRSIA
jgi:hypothetical protein